MLGRIFAVRVKCVNVVVAGSSSSKAPLPTEMLGRIIAVRECVNVVVAAHIVFGRIELHRRTRATMADGPIFNSFLITWTLIKKGK